jgi:hypothetical protein
MTLIYRNIENHISDDGNFCSSRRENVKIHSASTRKFLFQGYRISYTEYLLYTLYFGILDKGQEHIDISWVFRD